MSYKKKHPETCLAKSLLILVNKEKKIIYDKNKELDIFLFSLKYDRENISRGHIEKTAKDFGINIDWYVGTKIFFDFVKKRSIPSKTRLFLSKVNLKLIDLLLKKPIIIYLDQFYLWNKKDGLYYKYHYPHFIVVLGKIGDDYKIIDPNNGRVKFVNGKILSKAIISLRNHLFFSPQVIQIKS